MALATVADLEARIGALNPTQAARADALLADAAALVQSACIGVTLEETTSTVTLRPNGPVLRLPNGPVTDVDSVTAVDDYGNRVVITKGVWSWDGVDKIRVDYAAQWVINLPESWGAAPRYEVVCTHGFPPGSPQLELVRSVVANAVNRTLTAPTTADGVVGETIGQYSYQLQQGRGSGGTGVRISPEDRDTLRRAGLISTATTIETPIY